MIKPKEKSLAAKKDVVLLTNSQDTGLEFGDKLPMKYLSILQSSGQSQYFTDGEQIAIKDYGKLFLYEKGIDLGTEDLLDSVEGTIMRITRGYKILGYKLNKKGEKIPDRQNVIRSGKGIFKDKESYMKNNPEEYIENQVVIILALYDPQKTVNMVVAGEAPFIRYNVAKSAYGATFTLKSEMDKAIAKVPVYGKTNSNNVESEVFILVIKTKKVRNDNQQEYYVPTFQVKVNKPEVALNYRPIAQEWKKREFFTEDEVVDPEEASKALKSGSTVEERNDNKNLEDEMEKLEKEDVDDDEKIDIEDLPF